MPPIVDFEQQFARFRGNLQVKSTLVGPNQFETTLYVDNPKAKEELDKHLGQKITGYRSFGREKINQGEGRSFKEPQPETLKEVIVNPEIAGTFPHHH